MKKYDYGYTMIELIMVMTLIGMMAGFGVNRYIGFQKTTRDTQRKSDLRQYQTSLESYANTNGGFFPSRTVVSQADTILCTDLGLTDCPADPKTGSSVCTTNVCDYYFLSNGLNDGNANASRFALYAKMEKKNMYTVLCANGSSFEQATAPTIANCPL